MGCHCRIQYIPSMMMIVDVQECIIRWGIVKAFTTLAWIHLHLYHKSINLSTKMPRIRIWKSYECTYHILVNKFLKIDYEMKSSTTWQWNNVTAIRSTLNTQNKYLQDVISLVITYVTKSVLWYTKSVT